MEQIVSNKIILVLLAVFMPIKAVLVVVGFLIFADLFTGIVAAKKRGEAIDSAGFRRTIVKLFLYQTAILTGFLIETYLLGDFVPITKLVGGIIGCTEGLSIFENINEASGNRMFSKVIELLKSKNDTK